MKESEYIQKAIEAARQELGGLNEKFAAFKRKTERQIDEICEEAGIMSQVQNLRDSIERNQKAIQSRADQLQGRIQVLEHLHTHYHLAPIPEGVTHMYGIELAPLDPNTRLAVMHGQEDPSWEETIAALGGDPKRKEWDGTETPPEPEIPVYSRESYASLT